MDKLYKTKHKKFFAHTHNTWGHKWGYKDTKFILNEDGSVRMGGDRYELCGADLPDLIPYIEEMLGIIIDPNDTLPEVENKPVRDAQINEPFMNEVKSTFPEDRYSINDEDRLIHSHGQTTSEEVYKVLYSEVKRNIDLCFISNPKKKQSNSLIWPINLIYALSLLGVEPV